MARVRSLVDGLLMASLPILAVAVAVARRWN